MIKINKTGFVSLIFVLLSVSAPSFSQGFLVIGGTPGGCLLPFGDTAFSSYTSLGCGSYEYFVDWDGDASTDAILMLECSMGGMGGSSAIRITPQNGYLVHLDDQYVEYYQYIVNGQVRDTFRIRTVVKRYNEGDTIRKNTLMGNSMHIISNTTYSNWPFHIIYGSIDPFAGGTGYIALSRVFNSDTTLYFLHVNSLVYHLEVLECRSDCPNGIEPIFRFFPNPVSDRIHLSDFCFKAELLSLDGRILLSVGNPSGISELETTMLPKGLYLLRLSVPGGEIVKKLLKW